jgi:hypothetical protein
MLLQEESNYDIDLMKEQSINMIQKLNFKQKHAFNVVMHSVNKGLASSYLSMDIVEQEKHSFGK